MDEVLERARADAGALVEGGLDGILVEDFLDAPFFGTDVAAATGAAFIRVNVHVGTMWTDQGALEGRAARTLRARSALGVHVAILADVLVKHATPPPGLTVEAAAADTWSRGLADALVVSGTGTGKETDLGRVARARAGAPSAPVLVGSGVTPATVARVLEVADGAIVGTSLARRGQAGSGVDPARVSALVRARAG